MLSTFTAYKIALTLAWRSYLLNLSDTNQGLKRFLKGLSYFFAPIDYVRYREFQFIFNVINSIQPKSAMILDLGSPLISSLTLAKAFPGSTIFYSNIWCAECQEAEQAKKILNLKNYYSGVQDARILGFPSCFFDVIFSISVFEHIEPEDKGDILASIELERILKPGGQALITVPFSRTSFSEYLSNGIYGRTAAVGEKIFFQRFYDEKLLYENIISPSKLELVSISFVEERFFPNNPKIRLAKYINSKRIHRFLFGPLFPLLAKFFLTKPQQLSNTINPYICCIHLKKSSDRKR